MHFSQRKRQQTETSFRVTITSPHFILFLICVLLLTTSIAAFLQLSEVNYLSLHTNILMGLTDSMLILSPYLMLKPRFRRSILFPMIILPIILYANLLYIRNFGDLMSFTMMTGAQNATNMIWSGIAASMRWHDLWIGIPFLLTFPAWRFFRGVVSGAKFPLKFKFISVAFCLLAFIAQQIFLYRVFHLDFDNRVQVDPAVTSEKFHYRKLKYMERYLNLRYYGLIPYLSLETYKYLKPKYHKLNEDEMQAISSFYAQPLPPAIISAPANNRQKNLILIIVESLNSSVLTAEVDGKPALPYLDSIIKNPGIILATKMIPQVGIGRSSDAQFMYQTGLLPLKNEALAMIYPSADYPSIAKALKRAGVELNPGPPSQWNHIPMATSYGNLFRGGSELRDIPDNSLDAYIFNRALDEIPAKKPFLEIICSVDSHDPYLKYDGIITDASKDQSYLETERIYIEKLRQFDRALESFISNLKERNLYNNSVIVIASDHTARESTLSGSKTLNTGYIPLIILNSGVSLRTDAKIGQIDVFPTILDIMGVLKSYEWKGIGTSLLRNPAAARKAAQPVEIENPFTYPSEDAWKLSESMVTGGYFRE